MLEHDPAIQYRKEGAFVGYRNNHEWLRDFDCRISVDCVRKGILWDLFPENWSFGNGITIHKTHASPMYRTVIHGTDLTENEFLEFFGPTRTRDLIKIRQHHRTQGWETYEARWMPTTFPMYNHLVQLTWLVTTHELPEFAYQRMRALIEDPNSSPRNLKRFEERHFSQGRLWSGHPAFIGGHNALSPIS